jgi:transposase
MKKYNAEFKKEAVKIALSSDQPYSKTAQELGVNPKTFYSWIRAEDYPDKTPPEGIETMRLQKELKRTKQELEIVKKAAAYFAKHLK